MKRLDLGPSAVTVSDNLRKLREADNLSYAELSRRLGDIGHQLSPLALRRIEALARRVDVDDLLALCRALNVNPNALLVDPSESPLAGVDVTAFGRREAQNVWRWLDGETSLTDLTNDPLLFSARVRPAWRVISFEESPSRRALRELNAQLVEAGDNFMKLWLKYDALQQEHEALKRERHGDG